MGDDITFGHAFALVRDADPSGISGTGIVADGVLWPDDTVSIRWRGERPSIVFWNSLDDAMSIHGHNGATRIAWLPSGIPQGEYGAAWAQLASYVEEAADDGGTIDPATLLEYLRELRHQALRPVREWMDRVAPDRAAVAEDAVPGA